MISQHSSTEIAVLMSGGLDSSILVGKFLREGRTVHPIYIRTGLFWQSGELPAVQAFLAAIATANLRPLKILELPLDDLYTDHWSLTGSGTPADDTPDEAVYLPGRNALLLVKAAVYCQLHGIGQLACAPLGSSPFEDASSEFFTEYQSAMNRGSSSPVVLLRPFGELHKEEVMRLGVGLPLELTFSCIHPVDGTHCGTCNKCFERKEAFRITGIEDKTVYTASRRTTVQVATKSTP